MSWWNRITGRGSSDNITTSTEQRSGPFGGFESDPSWAFSFGGLPGGIANGGFNNLREGAETIAAVSACINFISSNLASLPPLLYSVAANGRRTENLSHSVNRVLAVPNNVQTWSEFVEGMMGSVLAYGNALALLEHDMSGRLVALNFVPWWFVLVFIAGDGSPLYDVHWPGRPTVRYLASEVLHIRDRGYYQYTGVSRLRRAAATISYAHSADIAANTMFERSVKPSGAFKVSGKPTEPNMKRFRERIREEVEGASKFGKTLILEDGLDFVEMGNATAHDAEILASRQWSTVDIARLFGVPPLLIGDWQYARGPVATEALTLFATTTLRSWVVKFESSFNTSVFGATTGATYALGLDMSGLQRADPGQHVAADNVLLSHGVITKNECRESWGYSSSDAPGMDDPAPQHSPVGGPQITGTQPGNMPGAMTDPMP